MKRKRAYQTLSECPIWNWEQVTKKDDLRYLWILDNYGHLPKLSRYAQIYLQHTYAQLVLQFDNLKSPVIEARKKVIIRILDLVLEIVATSKDIEKLEKASVISRAMMITPDIDESWLYNVDFTDSSSQKHLINYLAIEIKKYQDKVKKQKAKPVQSLYEQIARIESFLGVTIDSRRCSVLQFLAYQSEAASKSNIQNKLVG